MLMRMRVTLLQQRTQRPLSTCLDTATLHLLSQIAIRLPSRLKQGTPHGCAYLKVRHATLVGVPQGTACHTGCAYLKVGHVAHEPGDLRSLVGPKLLAVLAPQLGHNQRLAPAHAHRCQQVLHRSLLQGLRDWHTAGGTGCQSRACVGPRGRGRAHQGGAQGGWPDGGRGGGGGGGEGGGGGDAQGPQQGRGEGAVGEGEDDEGLVVVHAPLRAEAPHRARPRGEPRLHRRGAATTGGRAGVS